MRISIAMCTYNGASYLQQQLDSIAGQIRLPDELILCDDGSTDGTLDLAERFARSAPFSTRVIRNPANLGYSRNFANAVARCSHEIIALCDQDDIWYPNKLSHLERRFSEGTSIDGIFSNGDLIDSSSRPTGRTLWESFLFDADSQAAFDSGGGVEVLLKRNVVTGMAFAFRSRVKGLLDSVPACWIHDGWLAFLIAAQHKLVADPAKLVGYRVHGSQQFGTPLPALEKLRSMRNGLATYLTRLRERKLDEYERTALQFDEVAKFLRSSSQPGERALIALVEEKVAHSRRGAVALSSSRLRRLPVIAQHLDDYEDFSPVGWRALARDLLL